MRSCGAISTCRWMPIGSRTNQDGGGSMAEPSFGEQISTLNSTLRAIEVRLALGRAPVEGLEGFKSSLDDMRLRLWGLLGASGGDQGFQERFRIRRAIEMGKGLAGRSE